MKHRPILRNLPPWLDSEVRRRKIKKEASVDEAHHWNKVRKAINEFDKLLQFKHN